MSDGGNIARMVGLLGEPARASMLTALLGGQALTASELATVAAVSKSTASAHLGRLLAARLVEVESQGRHRYFRLADRHVANLLEHLMGAASRQPGPQGARPPDPMLHKARVCYDHLAGELGVRVFDSLAQRRSFQTRDSALTLSPAGRRCFAQLGVDVRTLEAERRTLCRRCLDWSVRRHHLAGALGAALLRRILELRWARRAKDSRALVFSALGEDALCRLFPVSTR